MPAGRSSVLCMYCGLPVPTPSPGISPFSPVVHRVISFILLGLLFVAAVSLLVAARLTCQGFDRLLGFLRPHMARVLWQGPAPPPIKRESHPHLVLTKSGLHRIIIKIEQSKEI